MDTNKMPIAKAGEQLKQAELVTAKLANASVRTIKETDEPVIVLEFVGLPGNVIRTVKQAKGDLSDFYAKNILDNMNSNLASKSYLKYYRDKDASFIGSAHEAGAIQIVDEFSKLYINGITNPETQQPYAIGDKAVTTSAGVRVEGFLSVKLTDKELDEIIERELKAIASKTEAMADLVP